MKKIIKNYIIFSTILILSITLLIEIGSIFLLRHYNIVSWQAISSVGEWASILVAVLIPISVIYLEKQVEKNTNEVENKKNQVKNSNETLFDEIKKLKLEISDLKTSTEWQEIKQETIDINQEVYKYVCIAMIVTTKEIMEKFNLSFDRTKEILLKLSRVDNLIKTAFISDNPNSEECHWQKR